MDHPAVAAQKEKARAGDAKDEDGENEDKPLFVIPTADDIAKRAAAKLAKLAKD